MNYETMKEKALDVETSIFAKIDDEAAALKAEYLDTMRTEYNDEDPADYASFEDYLQNEADDFLGHHFGVWIETLLEQLIGVTKADLGALLSSDEREKLTQPYMDHFKKVSELGNVSEDI